MNKRAAYVPSGAKRDLLAKASEASNHHIRGSVAQHHIRATSPMSLARAVMVSIVVTAAFQTSGKLETSIAVAAHLSV